MKIHRINAIILRYFLLYTNSYARIVDLFYWPLRDIMMWGLTSLWVFKSQSDKTNVVFAMLAGVVFWQVVLRTALSSGLSIFEELISHNLGNLFSTPLKLSEWIIAVICVSGVVSSITWLFGVLASKLIYNINILSLGPLALGSIIFSLMIFGLSMGFIGASFIIYSGVKVAHFAVPMLVWFFGPFVGIFYPLEILPSWAQSFSKILPPTYVFGQMRNIINNQSFDWSQIAISFALNIIYFILALSLFNYVFNKKRNYGLLQL